MQVCFARDTEFVNVALKEEGPTHETCVPSEHYVGQSEKMISQGCRSLENHLLGLAVVSAHTPPTLPNTPSVPRANCWSEPHLSASRLHGASMRPAWKRAKFENPTNGSGGGGEQQAAIPSVPDGEKGQREHETKSGKLGRREHSIPGAEPLLVVGDDDDLPSGR